jgi:CRISPR-associated protein Csb1
MPEQQATGSIPVTQELLDQWAIDSEGAVALHLKQKLLPVEAIESDRGTVFPPTYADIGYNIDPLSDGTKVATIDSVGSQANRMEPLFCEGGPLADLVPQIKIKINNGTTVSIFDLPHRAADATVQCSPDLASLAADAFRELKQGNAALLCALAPTSLVFGVWDSRGGTGEKRPRLVRSLIRAWDVEVLHAAAQFTSVWKKLDEAQQMDLKKEADKKRVDLSVKGLQDAPATFRKTKIPTNRDGAPNPDARVLGGVLVKGRIEREVTVNLLALRGLRGGDKEKGGAESNYVRQYLLGLTLLAATQQMDLFLREGCLLRYARTDDDLWYALPRRGDPRRINFANAHEVIRAYTVDALRHFKDKWPKNPNYEFNIAKAKELLAKKGEQEETPAAG